MFSDLVARALDRGWRDQQAPFPTGALGPESGVALSGVRVALAENGIAGAGSGPAGLEQGGLASTALGSLAGAEASAKTEDASASVLARTDRVEFVRRITEALESARARMPETVEFELTPPDLGRVRVSVTTGPEGMAARLEAVAPETRRLLREHLPQFEQHLRNQGLTVPKLEVAATANPGDSSQLAGERQQTGSSLADGGRSPGRRQESTPDGRWQRRRRETEPALEFRRTVAVSALLGSATGIDRTV